MRYIRELDGVRGLAALMVMYFHFFSGMDSFNNPFKNVLVKTSVFGQTGVILFFVLSGFLITRILLAYKNKESFFLKFYYRRALRIFPLYYLALLVYFSLPWLINNVSRVSTAGSWYYLLYLQNLAMTFRCNISGPLHFWSLAVEEHFYLVYPLIVYYVSRKRLLIVCYIIIIIAICLRFFLYKGGYEVFYFTGTTMDALAIGAILAIKQTRSVVPRANYKHFVGLLLVVTGVLISWIFTGGKGLLFIQVLKGTFIAYTYYIVLSIVINLNENQLLSRLLCSKALTFTGRISYGLYVYHVLCFSVCLTYFKTSFILLDLCACFILSYVLAYVSFTFYELRFIRLKDKFFKANFV